MSHNGLIPSVFKELALGLLVVSRRQSGTSNDRHLCGGETDNFKFSRYFEEKRQISNKMYIEIDPKISLESKEKLLKYWKQLKAESKTSVTIKIIYGSWP